MKGVVLAGGTGSRLLPLTKATNKQLLPVYNKPMVYYPLETLVNGGITDILVISGPEHMGQLMDLLGSGQEFGARLSYKIQNEPNGIAAALGLAEDFADGEKVAVILGDNIYEDSIAPFVARFQEQKEGAMIFLKSVREPERFGVAEIKEGAIVSIVEKPIEPSSDLAVTGLYFYDAHVFAMIKKLQPSVRGEYEITDINNNYLAAGTLGYTKLDGYWTDAGTFESLFEASRLVREQVIKNKKQ